MKIVNNVKTNEYKVVVFMREYDDFGELNMRYAVVYDRINTIQVINDIYDIINDCDTNTNIECVGIAINGIVYSYDTICKMHNNYKCA